MKKYLLLFLVFAPLMITAQCYCGYHVECYEGQTLVMTGLEWPPFRKPESFNNLFLDYNESNKKLKKKIKLNKTKQYLGSTVTVSRIFDDVEYDEKKGYVFELNNEKWGKLYYFYRPSRPTDGWDNEEHFQFEGNIYCKAYYDDQIRKSVDRFEDVTTYSTPKIASSYYYEGVTGFKSTKDSTIMYSILYEVVRDSYNLLEKGIYVILGDGSQIRDESATVSINSDEYGHYHYSALLLLTHADYERICIHGIDAFKVGSMEARDIKVDRKEYIKRYLKSLL